MEIKKDNNYYMVDEKEYFTDIARLKYAITEMMQKHNLINEIVVNNDAENIQPFYGRIENNRSLAVEFSRGVPSSILTPYGAVNIDAASSCRGYTKDYDNFIKDFDRTFGLIEAEPIAEKNNNDEIGPRCVITRLPWKEEVYLQRHIIMAKPDLRTIGNKKEQAHLREIYQMVNEDLIKNGHEAMVHSAPKPLNSLLKIEEPVKKRTCIIKGQLKQFLKQRISKNSDHEKDC